MLIPYCKLPECVDIVLWIEVSQESSGSFFFNYLSIIIIYIFFYKSFTQDWWRTGGTILSFPTPSLHHYLIPLIPDTHTPIYLQRHFFRPLPMPPSLPPLLSPPPSPSDLRSLLKPLPSTPLSSLLRGHLLPPVVGTRLSQHFMAPGDELPTHDTRHTLTSQGRRWGNIFYHFPIECARCKTRRAWHYQGSLWHPCNVHSCRTFAKMWYTCFLWDFV